MRPNQDVLKNTTPTYEQFSFLIPERLHRILYKCVVKCANNLFARMFVVQLKNSILYEYLARILKYVCVRWSGERHARAAGERTVSRRLEQRDLASHPQ